MLNLSEIILGIKIGIFHNMAPGSRQNFTATGFHSLCLYPCPGPASDGQTGDRLSTLKALLLRDIENWIGSPYTAIQTKARPPSAGGPAHKVSWLSSAWQAKTFLRGSESPQSKINQLWVANSSISSATMNHQGSSQGSNKHLSQQCAH